MENKKNTTQTMLDMYREKKDEHLKHIDVEKIMKEYNEAMNKCQQEYDKIEQEKRANVIKTLTKDELKLIVDLYMQDLLSIYEKKSNSKVDIIVR